MPLLLAPHEAAIDNKSRIALNSSLRKQLAEEDREQLVCRYDTKLRCLKLYPMSIFKEEVARIYEKLNKSEDKNILQQYFASSDYIDIEATGKIVLSDKYKDLLELKNDEMVLLVGSGNYIAIYKKDTYEKKSMSLEDLDAILDKKVFDKN